MFVFTKYHSYEWLMKGQITEKENLLKYSAGHAFPMPADEERRGLK